MSDEPALLNKLGIRAGTRVTLVHGPRPFATDVRAAGARVVRAGGELIFMFADAVGELADLPVIAHPAALWIVYPKARTQITQNDVLAAGRDAGLTDIKVVRFSDTHTALKFVVPRSRRP